MPSENSVDVAPASRRLPPVTIESLATRIEELEQAVHARDSGEHELAEQVGKLRDELRALSATVKGIDDKVTLIAAEQKKQTEIIGESPDLGTGKEGSGMRKQLSNLVDKQRVPPVVQWMTPIVITAFGIYQALKSAGILK